MLGVDHGWCGEPCLVGWSILDVYPRVGEKKLVGTPNLEQ